MTSPPIEVMESRLLFAWSAAAQLVDQDAAATAFPNLTGAGVTVAVIDTGIDYTLPALGDGFGAGKKVVAGFDFLDNDANPLDTDGHGTAVAAALAANPYTTGGITYRGIAPAAKLVALRVGTSDEIFTSNIEKALQWVIDNYQAHGIQIVNLSLGSGNFPDADDGSILADELATLRDLGIFVVAASGNANDEDQGPISEDGVSYPAADPNVFAVGAVDENDVITTWTQRGDELDLLATGVDMVLPALGGSGLLPSFEPVSGTSFAAPQVAGTAALLKQFDRTLLPGDLGSILMSSGAVNRDGDEESGDTTGLLFSRLDVDAALSLAKDRIGRSANINFGTRFDTALDSQGVLHAAWYDTSVGRVLYATRNVRGLWSHAYVVDQSSDVGANLSLAVDPTGHVGVGYFDVNNTAVKYASYTVGGGWTSEFVESDKHVGWSPSLAFDIDGNAYLAYYRRSGGNLKLAILDRDAGTWTREFIDGLDGSDVGAVASLDVGEAAVRTNGGFTIYDTTVAIAYADSTNGDLKYARLDLDDPQAEWFLAVVDDTSGVSAINLNLHESRTIDGLQAQIAYQDAITADVRFAYRNVDWFVEPVAGPGRLGDYVQLYFDADNRPLVAYSNEGQKTIHTASRNDNGTWSAWRTGQAWGPMSAALNERSGQAIFSFLARSRDNIFSIVVV